MAIDWDKPVQTRDGRPVRVLCRDIKGKDETILGLVEHDASEIVRTWFEDGGYIRGEGPCSSDLVNVPEHVNGWVNVYRHLDGEVRTGGVLFPSKLEAGDLAPDNRIACIKVEFEEGEGL